MAVAAIRRLVGRFKLVPRAIRSTIAAARRLATGTFKLISRAVRAAGVVIRRLVGRFKLVNRVAKGVATAVRNLVNRFKLVKRVVRVIIHRRILNRFKLVKRVVRGIATVTRRLVTGTFKLIKRIKPNVIAAIRRIQNNKFKFVKRVVKGIVNLSKNLTGKFKLIGRVGKAIGAAVRRLVGRFKLVSRVRAAIESFKKLHPKKFAFVRRVVQIAETIAYLKNPWILVGRVAFGIAKTVIRRLVVRWQRVRRIKKAGKGPLLARIRKLHGTKFKLQRRIKRREPIKIVKLSGRLFGMVYRVGQQIVKPTPHIPAQPITVKPIETPDAKPTYRPIIGGGAPARDVGTLKEDVLSSGSATYRPGTGKRKPSGFVTRRRSQ